MLEENGIPVVFDCGSDTCKVGFSLEDAPKIFHSVFGYSKSGTSVIEKFIGQEAYTRRGQLQLQYPIQHTSNVDWTAMIQIWNQCFRVLEVASSKQPCILTQIPTNPKNNRQKTTQIMFEQFQVPSFYLAMQSALSLQSNGRTTGVVLDVGETISHVVPFNEGFVASYRPIIRNELGGRNLTEYLVTLLNEEGIYWGSSAQKVMAKQMKEKISCISQNFKEQLQEKNKSIETYSLPDGKQIKLGDKGIRCPEALFAPQFLGKTKGMHDMVHESIMGCDVEKRRELYSDIILSGGTTLIPGFQERLHHELSIMAEKNSRIKIVAPPERKESQWMGGSILSSLGTFKELLISRSEYQETGPSIVGKKCWF